MERREALGDLNELFLIARPCHLRPGNWAGTTLFGIVVRKLNNEYTNYVKTGIYKCEKAKPTAMLVTLAPTYGTKW